jgi:outer membrane protein
MMISKSLGEYNVKRYKRAYIPTLNFNAVLPQNQYETKLDFTAPMSWFPTSYFGLNVNVPIFDGFYKAANIRQAKLQLQQTENNMDSLKNRIDNDVRSHSCSSARHSLPWTFRRRIWTSLKRYMTRPGRNSNRGSAPIPRSQRLSPMSRPPNTIISMPLYSAILARVDYLNAIGKL